MLFLSPKQTVARLVCFSLTLTAAFLFAPIPTFVSAQTVPNKSATDVVDPIRVGDKIEVKNVTGGWTPAIVVSVDGRLVEVETERAGEKKLRKYSINKIRYPNGEGQWAMWKTRDGKVDVVARYIARDEKDVMIRTATGEELTISIKDLALNLKARVKASPITGQENAVNGVVPIKIGDKVQVNRYSTWYPGNVRSLDIGEATVEYTRNGHQYTDNFAFANIRYPDGEWKWENWSDAEGTTKFEGRFISRNATTATIRKADGTDIRLPIAELAPRLKRRVLSVREASKINHINGADPFRPGDNVQIIKSKLWYQGVIAEVQIGRAIVEYKANGKMKTETFEFGEIRFPNGEGRWREWKSANGKFKIIGRYISRTKTHVTIRKSNGKDVTVPNQSLSSDLRRILAKTPITGAETLIGGVNPIRIGDEVEVRTSRYSYWNKSPWQPGVIVESHPEHALVELAGDKNETKIFKFNDIRYANGEGAWQKWATADKEFEIIARYIRRSKDTVTLLKENDKLAEVPINRLSTKLKSIVTKLPIVAITPDEIEFGSGRNVISFLAQNKFENFKEFTIDWESANTIKALKGGVGVELKYGDSVSGVTPLTDTPSELDLDRPWYALGTYATPKFKQARWTQLFWTCPSKQDYEQGPSFQPEEQIVDYSATQERLINLVLSDDHSEAVGFRTYKLKPLSTEAEPEVAWSIPKPPKIRYGSSTAAKFKVELVGDNQLLLSSSNSVSLHDFERRKVVYTIPNVTRGHFALHPSKQFFAVIMKDSVALIDIQTGKTMSSEKISAAGVGFSVDGSKIVVVGPKLRIWDLQSNSEPSVFERRNLLQSSSGPVVMIDDKWIKAGNQLYSLTKEIVVWSYAAAGVKMKHNEMLGGMNLLAASKTATIRSGRERISKTLALVGLAKVPHAPAVDALAKLEKLDMLILKPGSGVRIETEGSQEVREGVLAAIKKSGWHEDSTSDMVVKAFAKRGKTEKVVYGTYRRSRFGFSGFLRHRTPKSTTTVSATPWQQEVEILSGEQSAWKQSRTNSAPHSFDAKEGESYQRLVNEYTKPNYRMFETLEIPSEIIAPKYRNGLGRTDITINGFVDRLYAQIPEETVDGDQPKAD